VAAAGVRKLHWKNRDCPLKRSFAQAPLPAPPPDSTGPPLPAPPEASQSYSPPELDRIVSPIALDPDPLLSQILTAATFSPEIPEAVRWADQHHYLPPAQLPTAIAAARLPRQPSVQALLPFPQVLAMMATNVPWTEELGAAFSWSPQQVMDAVLRQRRVAYSYGYLRSNAQVTVNNGPFIDILPADPAFVARAVLPPGDRVRRSAARVVVGAAIRFGYGVRLGVAFAPWGWGTTRFPAGATGCSSSMACRGAAPGRTCRVRPSVRRGAALSCGGTRAGRERAAERDGHRRDEEHRR
jgi:uncharacterized protein DUF3300